MVDDIKKDEEGNEIQDEFVEDEFISDDDFVGDEDFVSDEDFAEDKPVAQDEFIEEDLVSENEFEDDFPLDDEGFEDDFSTEDDPYSEDDFNDDGYDVPQQAGSSFLKKNFHYITYGLVGLVGVYLVYDVLFPGGPAQQQSLQPIPIVAQAPIPKIEQPQLGVGENNNDAKGAQGLLLGGITSRDNKTAVQAEQKPVERIQDEKSRTEIVSAKKWQQPPMPTPISRDESVEAKIVEKAPTLLNRPIERQPSQLPVVKEQPQVEIVETVKTEEQEPVLSTSKTLSKTSSNDVKKALNVLERHNQQMVGLNRQVNNLNDGYARIDQRFETLNTLVGGLKAQLDEQATASSRAVTQDADAQKTIQELQEKLVRLEAIIATREADVQQKAVVVAPTHSKEAMIKDKEIVADKEPVEVMEKKVIHDDVAPTPTPQKTVAVVAPTPNQRQALRSAVKPSVKPVTLSNKWVLRAAQSGVAWVSRDFSSPIYKVFVGQEVEGLGRVLSISIQQGLWVVETTRGKIVQ